MLALFYTLCSRLRALLLFSLFLGFYIFYSSVFTFLLCFLLLKLFGLYAGKVDCDISLDIFVTI